MHQPPPMTPSDDLEARTADRRRHLEAERASHAHAVWSSIIAAICVPILLFGAVFALAAFVEPESLVLKIGWPAAFFLSLVICGPLLMATAFATDWKKEAAWRLQALEREPRDTEAAMALAASGEPFALFLRSFGAEAQGLSSIGRSRAGIAEGMAQRRADRHGDWYEPDISHISANLKWRAQLGVIHALAASMPTVLLGNTRLGDEMRSELAGTGVRELTIQAQEWWSIFLAISNRAAVTFFYIENLSPEFMREMQHIRAGGLHYVLCGEEAAIRGLAAVEGLGEAFLAGAAARLGPGETAAIPRLLGQWEKREPG